MSRGKLIYVVDDDEAVRDSLAMLLESADLDVAVFDGAPAALAACRKRRPDCIVTDVRMPQMNGLEFQEELSRNYVDIPVIVMTGHADVPLAVRAMKAGAVDFIEKPFPDDVILASVVVAMSRKARDVDPRIQQRLDSLTPRERDVLLLVVAGHPNKVIAHQLDISARTVEVHRARVMDKMEARSLPELVRLSMQIAIDSPG